MTSLMRRRSKEKDRKAAEGSDLQGYLRELRKGTNAMQSNLDASARAHVFLDTWVRECDVLPVRDIYWHSLQLQKMQVELERRSKDASLEVQKIFSEIRAEEQEMVSNLAALQQSAIKEEQTGRALEAFRRRRGDHSGKLASLEVEAKTTHALHTAMENAVHEKSYKTHVTIVAKTRAGLRHMAKARQAYAAALTHISDAELQMANLMQPEAESEDHHQHRIRQARDIVFGVAEQLDMVHLLDSEPSLPDAAALFSLRSASASPAFLSGDEASPPASPLRHDNHSPLEKSTMWRENFKNHSAARESVRMAGMLLSQGAPDDAVRGSPTLKRRFFDRPRAHSAGSATLASLREARAAARERGRTRELNPSALTHRAPSNEGAPLPPPRTEPGRGATDNIYDGRSPMASFDGERSPLSTPEVAPPSPARPGASTDTRQSSEEHVYMHIHNLQSKLRGAESEELASDGPWRRESLRSVSSSDGRRKSDPSHTEAQRRGSSLRRRQQRHSLGSDAGSHTSAGCAPRMSSSAGAAALRELRYGREAGAELEADHHEEEHVYVDLLTAREMAAQAPPPVVAQVDTGRAATRSAEPLYEVPPAMDDVMAEYDRQAQRRRSSIPTTFEPFTVNPGAGGGDLASRLLPADPHHAAAGGGHTAELAGHLQLSSSGFVPQASTDSDDGLAKSPFREEDVDGEGGNASDDGDLGEGARGDGPRHASRSISRTDSGTVVSPRHSVDSSSQPASTARTSLATSFTLEEHAAAEHGWETDDTDAASCEDEVVLGKLRSAASRALHAQHQQLEPLDEDATVEDFARPMPAAAGKDGVLLPVGRGSREGDTDFLRHKAPEPPATPGLPTPLGSRSPTPDIFRGAHGQCLSSTNSPNLQTARRRASVEIVTNI